MSKFSFMRNRVPVFGITAFPVKFWCHNFLKINWPIIVKYKITLKWVFEFPRSCKNVSYLWNISPYQYNLGLFTYLCQFGISKVLFQQSHCVSVLFLEHLHRLTNLSDLPSSIFFLDFLNTVCYNDKNTTITNLKELGMFQQHYIIPYIAGWSHNNKNDFINNN